MIKKLKNCSYICDVNNIQNILAVFRARSDTLTFSSILRSYDIPLQIINTPRTINVSCGISVKFNAKYLNIAKEILNRRKFDTFVGLYND